MSEEFEVRGAHEDRLDEAAEREPKGMAGQLAVMTAILATFDAAIKKTEASNQWNFYQAKSSKQNLSGLGALLVDDSRKPFFESEVKRYEAEKAEIKLAAEKLDKASADFDRMSEARMHQHHRWAQATTALQISIAMAAIALLTRKRWLEKAVFAMAGVGLVVGALAYLHV